MRIEQLIELIHAVNRIRGSPLSSKIRRRTTDECLYVIFFFLNGNSNFYRDSERFLFHCSFWFHFTFFFSGQVLEMASCQAVSEFINVLDRKKRRDISGSNPI